MMIPSLTKIIMNSLINTKSSENDSPNILRGTTLYWSELMLQLVG